MSHDLDRELDLERVKTNHRVKYLGRRSFCSTVIVRTHTQPSALPGPLDSFLHVLCVLLYTVCMSRFVTR